MADAKDTTNSAAALHSAVSGEIGQMQNILVDRLKTDEERAAFKVVSNDRAVILQDIGEFEEKNGRSAGSRLDAFRVDLAYAEYLSGTLANAFDAAKISTGQELFAKRRDGYCEVGTEVERQRAGVAQESQREHSTKPDEMTVEAIARDPWNAVALPLPAQANPELLNIASEASDHCRKVEHHLMMEAQAGNYTANWSQEAFEKGEAQPDAHEYNESRWFDAAQRFDAIQEAVAQREPQHAVEDEEEKQKRRASQSVDMGNPAHAQLGANIRPEVGSGPAGLETYTTQKSATYNAQTEQSDEADLEQINATIAQQGDGLTPPESLTLTAREQFEADLRAFTSADTAERRARNEERAREGGGQEVESAHEEGRDIDQGGDISM